MIKRLLYLSFRIFHRAKSWIMRRFTKAGLPVGLQILSDVFTEEKLLRIARMYEQEVDFSAQAPPVCRE